MVYGVWCMIRTQILLNAELKNELMSISATSGESLSEVIRNLLNQALAKTQPKKKTGYDFLQTLAKNASKGGPSDLSTNDDYLYKL